MAEPFAVAVAQSVLDDLSARLRATRWPDALPGSGWDYGTDLGYLRDLCRTWADGFDWRRQEARLNAWPQHVTEIDGARLHYLHARSPHPGALPLLLTHGWPGSVVEFLSVLGPLVDPPAHGGDPADAFTVVCPSIPGYGWSGPTRERGWDVRRVARALAALMAELGHDRYGAQGGDWGGIATAHLGVLDAAHLVGIHLNMANAPRPRGDDSTLDAQEQADLADMRAFKARETGYQAIQGTKPQTLAYALNDSPAGLAGWVVEKFRAWSDCGGDVESVVDRDDLLANLTTYWVTGTAGSAARLYYETFCALPVMPTQRVEVPTAVARFPREIYRPPRAWVEAAFDLRRWTVMPRGGHFAALEQPDLLVEDVRAFFRDLR
ncbi:MAG: epoxide hydrolase [Actinomycetota bacterium]|nr:epoxide hydrolase [Actinomycetota bacterium]